MPVEQNYMPDPIPKPRHDYPSLNLGPGTRMKIQVRSDNQNSSGDQLWHTLRAAYVDDAITPFLDPVGEL